MRGRALIIATSEYSDPQLATLRSTLMDAAGLKEVLSDPTRGDFTVSTCLEAPSPEWRARIGDFFLDASRDDLLLLYVSGHGVKDRDGKLYFASADTRSRKLLQTAVPASFIQECAHQSPSRRIVMIFDSCFSGSFAKGLQIMSDAAVNAGDYFRESTGRVVITASDAIQYALVDDAVDSRTPASLFSKHVISGLTSGDADVDGDGQITTEDLFHYVSARVRDETRDQQPQRWAFGVKGDFVLAANPTPRAGTLPQDVLDLIDSKVADVRLVGVRELSRLLAAGSVPRALAAREALNRLRADDSRRVSIAAEDVLRQAGVPGLPPAASTDAIPQVPFNTPSRPEPAVPPAPERRPPSDASEASRGAAASRPAKERAAVPPARMVPEGASSSPAATLTLPAGVDILGRSAPARGDTPARPVTRSPAGMDAAIDEGRLPAPQWRVGLVCALALLVYGFDTQAAAGNLSALATEMGVSFAWVVSTPPLLLAFGLAAGAVFGAPWADRLGRRPLVLGSLLVAGIAMLAATAASSWAGFLAGRLVTGLALGAGIPSCNAWLAEYTPLRHRARALVLINAAGTLGMFLPSLLGWLGWGWHEAFVIGGLVCAALGALTATATPESLKFLIARRPDDPRIPPLLAQLAHGQIDAPREHPLPDKGLPPSVLTPLAPAGRGQSLLLCVSVLASRIALAVVVIVLPVIQAVRGGVVPRVVVLIQIAGLVLGLVLAGYADRGRSRQSLPVVFGIGAAALAIASFNAGGTFGVLMLMLAGGCAAGAQLVLVARSESLHPAPAKATGIGWVIAAGQLSVIIAPLLVGAAGSPSAVQPLLLSAGIPLLLCVLLTRLLKIR